MPMANKMGEKVKAVAKAVEQKFAKEPVERINREYIKAMRDFSAKSERSQPRRAECGGGLDRSSG